MSHQLYDQPKRSGKKERASTVKSLLYPPQCLDLAKIVLSHEDVLLMTVSVANMSPRAFSANRRSFGPEFARR